MIITNATTIFISCIISGSIIAHSTLKSIVMPQREKIRFN